jgi:hypothetical protein
MAKSKLNLRFIGIFLAILVIGVGLIGFALYWQRVAGPERNFAAGERYMKRSIRLSPSSCRPPRTRRVTTTTS